MFLHTLKFRRLLSPRASFLIYAASYMITFYTFIKISDIFVSSFDICVLAIGGLLINFLEPKYQNTYQIFMLIILNLVRNNYIASNPSFSFSSFNRIVDPTPILKGEL